ncbi:type II secretion system protein GspM [uncultured Umboniibacter sp.]|uniref:type II secretion system protein GspM n=1 Tax=uncultured Umboniibacter sp. TaxID=1798917 RepID=UPI0026342930|nr:type II secretion system protein GspM [uncultured Umboniibacter sp.]
MRNLQQYWNSISTRDRRALAIMSIAIAAWIVISGVNSLLKTNANTERQIQQLRSQLTQMQQLLPVIKGNVGGARVSGNLATLVNRIGRDADVEYDSIRPNSSGLQLTISNITEEDFGAWLSKLKVHSLDVTAMSLTVDQEGQLAISMQLSTQ